VDTPERVLIASGVRDIEQGTPVKGLIAPAHLAGHGHRVKWRRQLTAEVAACNRILSRLSGLIY
jgi:hypothetical protein